MFTYEQSNRLLFSADAFGSFGALSGHVFDSHLTDRQSYLDEMVRYYACVVGKYGPFVKKALAISTSRASTLSMYALARRRLDA